MTNFFVKYLKLTFEKKLLDRFGLSGKEEM